MNIETEKLIIEYFEIKLHKNEAIMKQSYEEAAHLRDDERNCIEKLSKKLFTDIEINNNYIEYIHRSEDALRNYFLINYT